MKKKFISALSLLLLTSASCGYAAKLGNYQQIKNALLSGATVKAIINLKNDCKLTDQKGDEPKTRSNTIGTNIDQFIISETTGNILTGFSLLNAPRDEFPANYNNLEIAITPDNTVNLTFKIVTLGDYKTIKSVEHICTINSGNKNGITFYKA